MQLLLREVTHTATQEKPRANNLMSSSNKTKVVFLEELSDDVAAKCK